MSNPIANPTSVRLQLNWDDNVGPAEDGTKTTLNIQPVIPVSISEHWNMISRTILPVIEQIDIFPGADSQFGSGNITQSLFFSPKAIPPGAGSGCGPGRADSERHR